MHHVHVVLDEQHSHALVAQTLDVLVEALLERRVDAGHRLVEHHQRRVRHQRPGHLEQLALAARQRCRRTRRACGRAGSAAATRRPAPRSRAPGRASGQESGPPTRARHADPWRRASCSRSPAAWSGSSSAGTCAPCRAPPCGAAATPSIDWPSKDQSPASGLSKPVIRLKNVVLPAPLGPISAVIEPRWTSTRSTSTAVMPPKLRRTPTAVEDRVGLWHTGLGRHVGQRRLRRGASPTVRPSSPAQRPSNAISLRLPKMPCGRNVISSTSKQAHRA